MKLIYTKKFLILISFVLALSSCSSSSSGGDDDPTPPTPPTVANPSAATLIFPEDDTECNTGAIVSDTQSNVTFEWNASQNTDTYLVSVTNLDTNSNSQLVVSTNEATILINRGTPYEWFVTSRATGTSTTANSNTWRFYNEGPGVENYAPFPAEAISPKRGANIATTNSINLEWNASDVDDDIIEFEVFFDTNQEPTTSIGVTPMTNLINIAVTSGTTYYWKVVTRDEEGNTSTSEIFQFKIL